MASRPTPILDHVVILVPHHVLLNLPPWISEPFNVLNGGRHSGGVTENKLVLFQDGVYLELIAFLPGNGEERKKHNWGLRQEGHIIDWANSLGDNHDLNTIKDRINAAKTGIIYSDLVEGGRIRPDGTELKWAISSPRLAVDDQPFKEFLGGEAPFWCLDRSARELRVPYHDKHNVTHCCGALGVKAISIFIQNDLLFGLVKRTYDALMGCQGEAVKLRQGTDGVCWQIRTPHAVSPEGHGSQLSLFHLNPNSSSASKQEVHVEITLWTSSRRGYLSGTLGDVNWTINIGLIETDQNGKST